MPSLSTLPFNFYITWMVSSEPQCPVLRFFIADMAKSTNCKCYAKETKRIRPECTVEEPSNPGCSCVDCYIFISTLSVTQNYETIIAKSALEDISVAFSILQCRWDSTLSSVQ